MLPRRRLAHRRVGSPSCLGRVPPCGGKSDSLHRRAFTSHRQPAAVVFLCPKLSRPPVSVAPRASMSDPVPMDYMNTFALERGPDSTPGMSDGAKLALAAGSRLGLGALDISRSWCKGPWPHYSAANARLPSGTRGRATRLSARLVAVCWSKGPTRPRALSTTTSNHRSAWSLFNMGYWLLRRLDGSLCEAVSR
jgi:hypothetical protein